jgi:hypothetical protein
VNLNDNTVAQLDAVIADVLHQFGERGYFLEVATDIAEGDAGLCAIDGEQHHNGFFTRSQLTAARIKVYGNIGCYRCRDGILTGSASCDCHHL